MAKRKAEDVPSLQSALALNAALETPDGLLGALRYLLDANNEPMRQRIKRMGFVVARTDRVEKLIQDTQLLNERAERALDDGQKATFVKELKETIARYGAIGIEMSMAEKKRRFEGACVTNSRYGYSSNSRHNLEDGMCHIGDQDSYNPYKKAEESWHSYYAGPSACQWSKQVLEALGVPAEKFTVHEPSRHIAIEWRNRLTANAADDSDED